MKRTFYAFLAMALTALVTSVVPYAGSTSDARAQETLVLDVACDGNSFAVAQQHPGSSSLQRGDTFVLNGNIYKGGTIPEGGTKAAPSKFGPDKTGAIGEWFSRGSFLVSADQFSTEKIQRATTQYFALSDNKNRIVTEGFEGSAPSSRLILGGTSDFNNARGICVMERLGINATGAYNMRFTFTFAE